MKGKIIFKICWFVFYTFLLLEIFSRIAYAFPSTRNRLSSIYEEGYWRRSWVEQKQKPFIYNYDLFDPKTGWISKPNLRDIPLWDNKRLNTNNKGFRGKRDYQYKKQNDKVRILVLGGFFYIWRRS